MGRAGYEAYQRREVHRSLMRGCFGGALWFFFSLFAVFGIESESEDW